MHCKNGKLPQKLHLEFWRYVARGVVCGVIRLVKPLLICVMNGVMLNGGVITAFMGRS
jgi:hypothetical protein